MYALKSPVVFNKPIYKQVSEDIISKVETAFSQNHIYLKSGYKSIAHLDGPLNL